MKLLIKTYLFLFINSKKNKQFPKVINLPGNLPEGYKGPLHSGHFVYLASKCAFYLLHALLQSQEAGKQDL